MNGSAVPLMDFDLGESYAGLMPVGNSSVEDAQVCFLALPSPNEEREKKSSSGSTAA